MAGDLEFGHHEENNYKELWICPSKNGVWMSLSGRNIYNDNKEEDALTDIWLSEKECQDIARYFSEWLK